MESKRTYDAQPPLAIAEQRETFVREDGSTFTRSDIFVKLAVSFRDTMLARLKGPPLSVYLCIALHCGDASMTAWPSLDTIATETGYSKRAVITATRTLQRMRLIEITHRQHEDGDQDSNLYNIRGYATMGQGGERGSPRVVNEVHQGGERGSPEEETREEETREEESAPAARGSSADEFDDLFQPQQGGDKLGADAFLARHGHGPLQLARETAQARALAEHPDYADPTHDGDLWADGPLTACCAVLHVSPDHLSAAERRNWPKALLAWSQTWEDAAPSPSEAVACLRGFLDSELAWKTFTSPYEDGFQQMMDLMLNRLRAGKPFNAKGRAPSTGRARAGVEITPEMRAKADALLAQRNAEALRGT